MRGWPLISVVMPTYNAAAFVGEAVTSILAQTYRNFELIAVDDGSTDDTGSLLDDLARPQARMRVVHLPARAHPGDGPGRPAAVGLRLAQGDFIARMDADDIAAPERLALQSEWMHGHGLDICGAQAETFGAVSAPIWFPETDAAVRHEMVFRISILQPAMMVRAAVHRAVAYDERASCEDFPFFAKACWNFRLGNHPAFLHRYRQHAGQITRRRRAAIGRDVRAAYLPFLKRMFDDISCADVFALTRVRERQPAADPEDLDRAGRWMVRLARLPDPALKRRMTERWLAHCACTAAGGVRGIDALRVHYAAAIADQEGA